MSVPVTLKGGTLGANFLSDLHNYARMVWRTMTEYGMVHLHRWGEPYFEGVSHVPILRGNGTRRPPIFGTANMRTQSMRINNQILHGEEVLYTVHH